VGIFGTDVEVAPMRYGWETGTTMYLVAGKGPLGRLHRWWFQRRRRALDRRRNETVRRELAEVPTFDLPDRQSATTLTRDVPPGQR
jgi:hypothetical protein